MQSVGMGTKKEHEETNEELKKAFDGLIEENEKLHAKIGELEKELESKEPKEAEPKVKK